MKSQLDPHSIKVLEFDRILDLVSSRAPSSLGRAALAGAPPTADREEVLLRQRRTTQMQHLRESNADISWGGSGDLAGELDALRAEGSWIEPAALLKIAAFTEASRRLRRAVTNSAEVCPDLQEVAAPIADFRSLQAKIMLSITPEGEVADAASPELGRIRRGLEQARRDLFRLLERTFEGAHAEAFQEKIITRRQGRYVVPVKAGSRGSVPGLVHDRSASGQTLYIEPEKAVKGNNTLRELSAAEREEVLRILKSLGDEIRGRRADFKRSMTAMGLLEAVWARALLGSELDLVEPEIFEEPGRLELVGAWHPLLRQALGADPVPIDFSLGESTNSVVLTGPNTGGKTVVLKTIGLLSLMAQGGLGIPAQPGSGLSCFREILADIGDEQSIEQSLSTFSGHMKNVIAVIEKSGPETLVLLDELGAGTDPSEGAALGIAILEETLERKALTVATSHHNAVKVFASITPGVINASMEFDSETLQPTYRLVKGIPGRSQAFHIAARLGLEKRIVERARRQQSSVEVRLDSLMADLEEERKRLLREQSSVEERARRNEMELDEKRRKLNSMREKIEKRAREVLRGAERELALRLRELKKKPSASAAKAAKDSLQKMRGIMKEHLPPPETPPIDLGGLEGGDRVYLRTLRVWGDVEEVHGETVAVAAEGKRFTVSKHEIEKLEKNAAPVREERRTAWGSYTVEVPPAASSEIDVRGMRAEEALARIEQFMEHALLGAVGRITIIHGKGSGRLQAAVGEYLSGHPRVEAFGAAPLEEGGSGATKVTLSL